MRRLIQKLGRINVVIIITVFTILASVGFTLIIFYFRQDYTTIKMSISMATITPLILSPFISWPLMGLLMKVDELEKEMRKLVTFDSLTGLLSRRAFFHDAKAFIEFAKRKKIIFSIILLDIDNFKNVNDCYGHSAGDEVLRDFAKTARTITRKGDLIGRIGGEEFALLLPNSIEAVAYAFSERLHEAIRESVINYGNLSIKYTVSMGLFSILPIKSDTIENILKNADMSLYLAKENGRNRTVSFNANKANVHGKI